MKTSRVLQLASLMGLFGLSLAILPNCKRHELPVLMTMPASDIKASSVLLGGQIISDGGAKVTSMGICWGTKSGPDITGSKSIQSNGTGSFTYMLFGLNQNTLYYARAYATNSEGTAYGGEVQFRTFTGSKPEVMTIAMSGYFDISAGVKITNDGGFPITEKGICLSTNENPTINDTTYITDAKVPDGSGYYMCYADQLNPKTTYHVRAYAINACGISYGDDESVATKAVPVVSTDAVTGVTNNSATISGNMTTMGDANGIVEIGVCYGTEKEPLFFDLRVIADCSVPGKFTCNLTNLGSGKFYYARTYVAWDYDNEWLWFNYVVYGNELTFTTKN